MHFLYLGTQWDSNQLHINYFDPLTSRSGECGLNLVKLIIIFWSKSIKSCQNYGNGGAIKAVLKACISSNLVAEAESKNIKA